jgi:hypothetical protein
LKYIKSEEIEKKSEEEKEWYYHYCFQISEDEFCLPYGDEVDSEYGVYTNVSFFSF